LINVGKIRIPARVDRIDGDGLANEFERFVELTSDLGEIPGSG
jgi:hypothetical protein